MLDEADTLVQFPMSNEQWTIFKWTWCPMGENAVGYWLLAIGHWHWLNEESNMPVILFSIHRFPASIATRTDIPGKCVSTYVHSVAAARRMYRESHEFLTVFVSRCIYEKHSCIRGSLNGGLKPHPRRFLSNKLYTLNFQLSILHHTILSIKHCTWLDEINRVVNTFTFRTIFELIL